MCGSFPSGIFTVVPVPMYQPWALQLNKVASLFAARCLSSSQGDRAKAAAPGSSSGSFGVAIFVVKCVLQSVQV